MLEGLKDNVESLIDYSHLTKSVAECYRPVKELVDDENIKEYLPECWVTLVKVIMSLINFVKKKMVR